MDHIKQSMVLSRWGVMTSIEGTYAPKPNVILRFGRSRIFQVSFVSIQYYFGSRRNVYSKSFQVYQVI